MSLMSDNYNRLLQRHAGIFNKLPRIANITKLVNLYGYLEPKKSENIFKFENIQVGIFSASLPASGSIESGDLIYDRHDAKYGYVVNLYNEDYAYKADIYMCNSIVSIAHPTETVDAYNRKTISWTTTIHYNQLRVLIAPVNLSLEDNIIGSKIDKTLYYCYLQNNSIVHQGDRIFDGDKYYLVKNIDDVTFNGALKMIEMGIVNV